jgi:hypothetical protein
VTSPPSNSSNQSLFIDRSRSTPIITRQRLTPAGTTPPFQRRFIPPRASPNIPHSTHTVYHYLSTSFQHLPSPNPSPTRRFHWRHLASDCQHSPTTSTYRPHQSPTNIISHQFRHFVRFVNNESLSINCQPHSHDHLIPSQYSFDCTRTPFHYPTIDHQPHSQHLKILPYFNIIFPYLSTSNIIQLLRSLPPTHTPIIVATSTATYSTVHHRHRQSPIY